jgi:membrane protein DedA with SNARE-associated domain
MLIENIGIPFPIEAGYLVAAALIKQGASYPLMLGLLTAGHLLGSIAAFGLGWWGEGWLTKRLQHKRRFLEVSESLHKWYKRYGSITIFATRFIGYVRPWSSLAAGFAQMRWLPFLLWTFAGTLLFNVIVLEFTLYFLDW